MIFLYIVLTWILVELQAPAWVYILFIIGIITKFAVDSMD